MSKKSPEPGSPRHSWAPAVGAALVVAGVSVAARALTSRSSDDVAADEVTASEPTDRVHPDAHSPTSGRNSDEATGIGAGGGLPRWITHRWGKWVALIVSLLIAVGVGSFASKLGEVQNNDVATWLPSEAQSTRALAQSAAFTDPDSLSAIIVFTDEAGIQRELDQISVARDAIIASMQIDAQRVTGPEISDDGQAAQIAVSLKVSGGGFADLPDRIDQLRSIATSNAGYADVAIAGPAAFAADQASAFAGIDTRVLFAALGVVIVMLLLTYRSPILWLIPLFCAVASVAVAEGSVYLLAKNIDLTVNSQSSGILSVLVLGASIDYALLLVARYREELLVTKDRHRAMARALRQAAPAILASGGTVAIGLLCLVVAQMNSTSGLGPVAASGIVAALFMMLVLLPALLVIFGRWVFWPFVPRFGADSSTDRGAWARIGGRIARRPRLVWVSSSLLLAALSLGLLQLNATGLSDADTFTTTQPSTQASEVLERHFPAGAGSPVIVISSAETGQQVAERFREIDGIVFESVRAARVKGDIAFVQGDLTSAPDSPAALRTVERVRNVLSDVYGGDVVVGGSTALLLDRQNASSADTRTIIPLVLAVVLVVLLLLLRALVAPLILLATVVLSFAASLGLSAIIFRQVFGFAGADPSLPLFAFVFLVALGIDYNIFLMTRVREETPRHGTRRAALIALGATGAVITSAGLVLAGTFAALGSVPLVFLAELGFVVALGVLIDTFIVRSVLVTALNLDLGRVMWWPSRLDRRATESLHT